MRTRALKLPDLPLRLEELLAQVPRGRVTTYGDLAAALGHAAATRWVGHWLLHHEHAAGCGCHRVVRVTGELGGYIDGGATFKARRLKRDGVPVKDGSVSLEEYRFTSFRGPKPLRRLERLQNELVERLELAPHEHRPEQVGGIDVSYAKDGRAVAAYSLVDTETGVLDWSTTVWGEISFPYIPGFLSFRESGLLSELIDQVRRAGKLADVLLVDGTGIMHPRGIGIASHVGLLNDVSTIGISKKLLFGRVDIAGITMGETRPVTHDEKLLGLAMLPNARRKKPIYVSPGNRVDVTDSARIVRALLLGRNLPEPIYWADRLSRREVREQATQRVKRAR